jgi:hypothetical protein
MYFYGSGQAILPQLEFVKHISGLENIPTAGFGNKGVIS